MIIFLKKNLNDIILIFYNIKKSYLVYDNSSHARDMIFISDWFLDQSRNNEKIQKK